MFIGGNFVSNVIKATIKRETNRSTPAFNAKPVSPDKAKELAMKKLYGALYTQGIRRYQVNNMPDEKSFTVFTCGGNENIIAFFFKDTPESRQAGDTDDLSKAYGKLIIDPQGNTVNFTHKDLNRELDACFKQLAENAITFQDFNTGEHIITLK